MASRPEALLALGAFADLSAEDAAATSQRATTVSLGPGERLFRTGDAADSFYILVAGEVDVVGETSAGAERLVTLNPGALLGELALLLESARSATVLGRTEAELWRISRETFLGAVANGEPWASRLLLIAARHLAGRLLALDQQLLALIARTRGEGAAPPSARASELERLREHLVSEWAF